MKVYIWSIVDLKLELLSTKVSKIRLNIIYIRDNHQR